MNETEIQFSITRAASSTGGRAKKQIPISHTLTALLAGGFMAVCLVSTSGQDARFFRIAGPVATQVTGMTADGTITWTNTPTSVDVHRPNRHHAARTLQLGGLRWGAGEQCGDGAAHLRSQPAFRHGPHSRRQLHDGQLHGPKRGIPTNSRCTRFM